MTEQEWLDCADPMLMLEFLHERGIRTGRKYRLFVCACSRRWWRQLRDGRSRKLVEILEAVVDGLASEDELLAARAAADVAWEQTSWGKYAAGIALDGSAPQFGYCGGACEAAVGAQKASRRQKAERAVQCRLLHELIGPLLFHPAALKVAWLTWGEGASPKLAQAIYDDRAFDRLPILADALEEARCTNRDILGHLRSPGPHVRGCWVVDLLTERK